MGMNDTIVTKVRDTLVRAGSTFSEDKKQAYRDAIARESSPCARWVLETILENALVAKVNMSPLCDDTGIPHLFLELGRERAMTGETLELIKQGIAEGLRKLPGRPMAIMGDDVHRIDQSGGISEDSADVLPAPIIIKPVDGNIMRLHILMQGGGPAIRGKTYRVFHKHSLEVVTDEIVKWSTESVSQLGCSPCTLAVGIGRSQLEASALMTEAQVIGRYSEQNDMEREITRRVNESRTGALGIGGDISVLGTFIKVGPQRASGVRIVCMHPCCCFEPRLASVEL